MHGGANGSNRGSILVSGALRPYDGGMLAAPRRALRVLFAVAVALASLALPAWAAPLRVVVAPVVDRTGRIPAEALAAAEARARQRLGETGRFTVVVATGTPEALALIADTTATVAIEPADRGQRLSITILALPSMRVLAEGAVTFDASADVEAAVLRALDDATRALAPWAAMPVPGPPLPPLPPPFAPPPPRPPPRPVPAPPYVPPPPPRLGPPSTFFDFGIDNHPETFAGLGQFGLSRNHTRAFSGVLQLALRGNEAGLFSGSLQLAPGFNEARSFSGGLQIAASNRAESLTGLGQIGVYNRVGSVAIDEPPRTNVDGPARPPWAYNGAFQIGAVNDARAEVRTIAQLGLVNLVRGDFSGLLQAGAWSTVIDGETRAGAQVGVVAIAGRTFDGIAQVGLIAASWGAFRGFLQVGGVSYTGHGLFREVGVHGPSIGTRPPERASFFGFAQVGGMAATDADFNGALQLGVFSTAFGDFRGGLEVGVINYVDHRFLGLAQVGVANVVHRGFDGGLRIGVVNVANDYATITQRYDDLWVRGGEIGAVNVNIGSLTGAQIGVFNMAHEVRGVQIGVVNQCYRLRGVQIGLLNLCDEALARVMPVFNAGL